MRKAKAAISIFNTALILFEDVTNVIKNSNAILEIRIIRKILFQHFKFI